MQVYLFLIFFLLVCSAFFSGSETAVMALNRYRLQHNAKMKAQPQALRLQRLLSKPERLLSMILIGNTFANIILSTLCTWVTLEYLGADWLMVMPLVVTLVVLVFAEVLPKTLAAHFADILAYKVAPVLDLLFWLSLPLIYIMDFFTQSLLRFFGVCTNTPVLDKLSHDELRSMIQSERIALTHTQTDDFQDMLVGVLDLAKMTVNDVIVPRGDVLGVDLAKPWSENMDFLAACKRTTVLVYHQDINNAQGILPISRVIGHMQSAQLNKSAVMRMLLPVQYIPEGTSLTSQLRHFQEHAYSIALVVDEYGDVCGLISIQDIIEEVVGQFTDYENITIGSMLPRKDGSYCLSGQLAVRDINRLLGWQLPDDGPNTLSGLIIEYLGCLPVGPVGVYIAGYKMEVMQMKRTMVFQVRIFPPLKSDVK